MERGLSGKLDVLLLCDDESLSPPLMDATEGELVNLIFSALEKLHFFEGVL